MTITMLTILHNFTSVPYYGMLTLVDRIIKITLPSCVYFEYYTKYFV